MAARGKQAQGGAKSRKGKEKSGAKVFDLPLSGWVRGAVGSGGGRSARSGLTGRAVYLGRAGTAEKVLAGLGVSGWQAQRAAAKASEIQLLTGPDGPVWLLKAAAKNGKGSPQHGGMLEAGGYGLARHAAATLVTACGDFNLDGLEVHGHDLSEDEQTGFVVGLEMGAYRYLRVREQGRLSAPGSLKLEGFSAAAIERGAVLGTAVNLARHLVNVPAGELDPETFSDAAKRLFAGADGVAVEVWGAERLRREGCGLLAAVGAGASTGPALVRISYRPRRGRGGMARPLAFVGKGVTFDSGGLNLKDSGSMRLMKKDMGGSASVLALAWWAATAGVQVPCDFYLALAENAVSAGSFHPGDVLKARSGLTVEIDNTDAEGRLVLADAIDVAVTQTGADAPAAVIDLATLTGAMRVALGTRIAGFCSNDDRLADLAQRAAQRRGDLVWRLPLFGDYLATMKSTVADTLNSGTSRFGGAITAALFLQKFVRDVPWLHVDMYAWSESGNDGCQEAGGNGQCVQLFSDLINAWA